MHTPLLLAILVIAHVFIAPATIASPPLPVRPVAPAVDRPSPSPPTDPADCTEDTPHKLLGDLERMTDDLVDFTARIVYERLDSLTEESELRYGRVVYFRPPPAEGRHRMAILLDEFVDQGGRRESIDQRYVWADGWLVDIDASRKQFIKRQIAPPDSDHDPLRIGEGPFPLPIGQRRTDVESRFKVAVAPPPHGRLGDGLDPAALRSLRLVPRHGVGETEEFRTVDLHYDRSTLLPVLVIAEDRDGSIRTVRLLRPSRNAGLPDEDRALLSAQTPDPGAWTIDIRPWRSTDPD